MEQADQQLVQKCKQTLPYDTTAFEVLLRRYEPLVFRTCCRYLGSVEEAEEACQDVFLRTFHAIGRFQQRSTFRTWLFRIVANVCATRWAKLSKRTQDQSAFLQATQYEVPAGEYEPSQEPLDDVGGRIGDELDKLASQDRHVLILRHVSGLSLEELAGSLEIGLSAAKMRLYRAEQRLRAVHDEVGNNPEKNNEAL